MMTTCVQKYCCLISRSDFINFFQIPQKENILKHNYDGNNHYKRIQDKRRLNIGILYNKSVYLQKENKVMCKI